MILEYLAGWLTQPINGTPLWNWALQAIGVLTAYIGAELNARGKIAGFPVWMVSNLVLAIIHIVSGLWLLFVLDLLFLRVNFVGLRRWRKMPPMMHAGGSQA